jgi:hypothetical protein
MSERRQSDWDAHKYGPANLSFRRQLILVALTALAVVLFLAGNYLVKLRKEPEGAKKPTSSDDSEAIIRVGDSLLRTIEKLRRQQISIADVTGAIAWDDGKDRRLYQVSKSRTPKDALVLVALQNAGGSDSPIESMYWDVDFVKQHVPKSQRPDPVEEKIESVKISGLISALEEPPAH